MSFLNPFAIQVLDIRDLVNFPFKALNSFPTDPYTAKFLSFVPIIAFVALIITAIWRQSKKFPVRAIGDTKSKNMRTF